MDIHLSNFKKMMGLLGLLSLASIKFAFKKIGVLRGFGPEKCPIWILPQIFFQKIGVLRGCRPKKGQSWIWKPTQMGQYWCVFRLSLSHFGRDFSPFDHPFFLQFGVCFCKAHINKRK